MTVIHKTPGDVRVLPNLTDYARTRAPGDSVTRGQVVAVVETTKAAVEVECWHDGTVHELLVSIGETVQVGTPLATLLAPGETGARAPTTLATPTEAPSHRTASTPVGVSRRAVSRRRWVSISTP